MKVSISKVQTPVGIILKKTKFSSSKQLVNPKRQLKKEKKGRMFWHFCMPTITQKPI